MVAAQATGVVLQILDANGNVLVSMFQPAGTSLLHLSEGQGLNPLLRHPGMIIHPPMLYLGFVSFVIPYAFAMAALITGRTDDRWIRLTRRWTLVAWLFLSLGLILGGRWAYDVLGWGGYWGWDPVEIAAFMPWLTGTAFLHSVMIQEKRGLFKRWNMILIILTYCLVIFGTFLTRSGIVTLTLILGIALVSLGLAGGLTHCKKIAAVEKQVAEVDPGSVGEIQAEVEIPGPTLSHHLDQLRRAGLVESRKEERYVYYSVKRDQVTALVRLLTACC